MGGFYISLKGSKGTPRAIIDKMIYGAAKTTLAQPSVNEPIAILVLFPEPCRPSG